MPRWEVCRIETRYDDGFLGFGRACHYLAVLETPRGAYVIDRSDDVTRTAGEENELKRRNVYSKLVGRLLAGGWEPLQADDSGQVIVFRRLVP